MTTVTLETIETFAAVSGDRNPVHLDDEAARAAGLPGRVAHGMLGASFISAAIADRYPGAIYLSQLVNFRRPVLAQDDLTVSLRLVRLREDKPIALIRTEVTNQRGEVVIDGEAVVKLPRGEAGGG